MRIYNGDCLKIMPLLPAKSVDIIITDPPYGVNLKYNSYDDTDDNWKMLMDKAIPEMKRVANIIIMPSGQIKKLEWIYKNHPPDWLVCWYKGSCGCSGYLGFNDWEPLLVYGKNKSKYIHDYISVNPQKDVDCTHPCPKPLKWAMTLINKFTDAGMTVLDPFAGSFTTGVACQNLGRHFIGIEIDKTYYEIGKERMAMNRKLFDLIDY